MERETKKSEGNFRPKLRKIFIVVNIVSTIGLAIDQLEQTFNNTPNIKFEDYALEQNQHDEQDGKYDDYHR